MHTPTVSVVVPTKDRQDLLGRLLDGLLREQIAECIVVATAEPAARIYGSPVSKVVEKMGASFAEAVNAGAKEATGDWLWLLNDDVVLSRPMLATAITKLATSDAPVIGMRLLYPNGLIQHAGIGLDLNGNPYNLWRGAPGEHPEAMKARPILAVTFASAFVRWSAWRRLGGLDEGYQNAYEDLDFCLRCREEGYTVTYDHRLSATHLEAQSAGRNDHVAESWQHFREKWLATGRLAYVTGVWAFSRGGG